MCRRPPRFNRTDTPVPYSSLFLAVFGVNMVALVDGRPQLLNLKQILEAFVRHRREVVTRRTIFELRKARARAHVLGGPTVALANIDELIELIQTSRSEETTSELQSLMRISYAVFCLKKKINM